MTEILRGCIVCGRIMEEYETMHFSDGDWCWKCDDKYMINGNDLLSLGNKPVPPKYIQRWRKYRK